MRSIKNYLSKAICIIAIGLLAPSFAYAGDAATLIFKSGQVVRMTDGFPQLLAAMKGGKERRVVDLTVSGETVLVDMSEVVLLCRDRCSTIQIRHQLDPSRAKEGDRASRTE